MHLSHNLRNLRKIWREIDSKKRRERVRVRAREREKKREWNRKIYTHLHTCIHHAHVHKRTRARTHERTHTYTHARTHTHTRTHTHAHTHTHTHTHKLIHMRGILIHVIIIEDCTGSTPFHLASCNGSEETTLLLMERYNTPQQTATHYNTLQFTATCIWRFHLTRTNATNRVRLPFVLMEGYVTHTPHCNTLQYTAIHCDTLPHTTTHWNTRRLLSF